MMSRSLAHSMQRSPEREIQIRIMGAWALQRSITVCYSYKAR